VPDLNPSQTRVSLLVRLRQGPRDQAAWHEFVDRYGHKIYGWCRYWKLQDADAQDVTQIVLTKLAEKMLAFEYDPAGSFRAWLKTLTHHAWTDFVRGRQRSVLDKSVPPPPDALETIPARDTLVARLQEAFDQELLEEASARVQRRVEPHTWEAFRLTALEGLSGAEAAARLGLPVGAVFLAKSRVKKLLQETIRQLEGPHLP
jgi:RNA polymerase sigma-70 factor (ECF subfamily)